MFKNKKRLITSGCSYTEGHKLKSKGSWATYLAKNNDCELVNLGRGGASNKMITQGIIDYAIANEEVAQDSFFIIQLSEFSRHTICWEDLLPDEYQDVCLCCNTTNMTIAPSFFEDLVTKTKKQWFQNWPEDDKLCNWLYENRFALASLYSNITFHLVNTYDSIINFVNFCENNNYPYFIFDGLCSNMPVEVSKPHIIEKKWYMSDNYRNILKKLEVSVHNYNIINPDSFLHHLPITKLKYIENLKNYYTDITLHNFIHNRKGNSYYIGNDGHPNELGSQMWANELENIIGELYE